MDIRKATERYETWVRAYTTLISDDLDRKHEAMTAAPFPFMRATYYRWAQRWPHVCSDLAEAPCVLGVADLHVENFGTWRDAEGRLAWGVNDFDEACPLPYASDLVRLCVSATLAAEAGHLRVECVGAAAAILDGYREQLASSSRHPFVLAEKNDWLRNVARGALIDPVAFWRKMSALPEAPRPIPESAIAALEHSLPGVSPGESSPPYTVRRRTAGLGSLGHPRYVALHNYEGGPIAREAKALVPSAAYWAGSLKAADGGHGGSHADHGSGPAEIYYQAILDRAVRCHDPFVRLAGHWIVRRLAPDCSRIELTALPDERDEARLLRDMGRETANIHLGAGRATVKSIRADLERRKGGWLNNAASAMQQDLLSDWKSWKKG
jgi:hypothetical protein